MPAEPPEANVRDDYRYVLELFRTNGEAVGQVTLTPDWEPAIECARFAGLRAFGTWATQPGAERQVEPLWHDEIGEPYVRAFRVHFEATHAPAWYEDFPATMYFGESARTATAELVESGTLTKGDRVVYRVAAFAHPTPEPGLRPSAFDSVDTTPALAVRPTSISALLATAVQCADRVTHDTEVLLPQWAVDEASTLTRGAGARETGGILIGHLHRDPVTREFLLEVTAQIPARHTTGDAVKLTFTSDTWTDVRNTIALRRRDEMMLGWWHSHPAIEWCKDCSLESQRVCHLASGFLSAEDKALHRAMFPRAFSIALVMTHTVAGVGATLFGWRSGLLEKRGFHLLGAEHHEQDDTDDIVTGGEHAAPTPG